MIEIKQLNNKQLAYTMNSLYQMFGVSDYNSNTANTNLIDLNNNPMVPTYERLNESIANYKNTAEEIQKYSEFMKVWDAIYKKTISTKASLLALDKYDWCINMKDREKEMKSPEYLADVRRVKKFFQKFDYKKEFRDVINNVLVTDTYFCWLRDSSGSFDDKPMSDDLNDYNIKRGQKFALQMMPQEYCRLSGRSPDGYLWDFDLNYFNQYNTNISNFDPSLIKQFNDSKQNNKIKSFVVNDYDANQKNNYADSEDGYVRVGIEEGAWLFKYDTSNFNAIPPYISMLKSVFNNDVIEQLQKDKDMIGVYMILTGEMETNKDTTKSPLIVDLADQKEILSMARRAINKTNIKEVPFALQDIKNHQFQDYNINMYKNQLKTSASKGNNASDLIYSNEKLGEFAEKASLELDYLDIAQKMYPQFEAFLNYYVNKKTVKYKFKFTINGSAIPYMRKAEIDNLKMASDMGMQVPPKVWGAKLGFESDEFEQLMAEARYGDMQDLTFLMLNVNTTSGSESKAVGNPEKSIEDRSDSGSQSHEYG